MSVYGIYVISESGSLQFYYDHSDVNMEVEKKYDFPLPFHFKAMDGRIVVDFGACDDVKIGYTVISVDGITAKGTSLEDNRDILKVSNLGIHLFCAICSLHNYFESTKASTG